jgi:hypothetical protein
VLDAPEVHWFEPVDFVHLAPQQCDPGSRCGQHEAVAFALYLLGALLVMPCRPIVSRARGGKRSHEEGTRVAYTGSREVGFDGRLGPFGEFEDPVPAAADLLDLEQHGDGVETMVIREGLDDRVMLDG